MYSPRACHDFPDTEEVISELHHGKWLGYSWQKYCDCKMGSIKILVPIILYIDGISLDAHRRLTLTPLNTTLEIFNVKTRKQPEAWETLFFCSDNEFQSSNYSSKADPVDNMQNLHNRLRAALQSFKEVCGDDASFSWDELPYAGGKWKVLMKFAIAYVVGNTVLHDQLCGRYGSCGKKVKQLC